jgi:hypothetical protein
MEEQLQFRFQIVSDGHLLDPRKLLTVSVSLHGSDTWVRHAKVEVAKQSNAAAFLVSIKIFIPPQ